ncbi:hypothetical protein [Nevskia sp.]|uniref:hypothetical protein n=1 Tax=Nevskia sp. TaxID=1929292 RepID=UPI0025F15E44|nr:hypothetical protein [Nevskia sp.]
MTLAQIRALQALHSDFIAAEGRQRAAVLRGAQHAKARDWTKLIGDLYGDA